MGNDLRQQLLAELDAAIAICEAATEGPWAKGKRESGCLATDAGAGGVVLRVTNDKSIPRAEDMNFIAYVRTGYPALLRATRAEVERHESESDDEGTWCNCCTTWGGIEAWPCRYLRDLAAALEVK